MPSTSIFFSRIFGLCVESDCILPELQSTRGGGAALRVQALPAQAVIADPLREIRRWDTADGRTVRIAAITSAGYLLRFPGNADFLISQDCSEIRYRCQQADGGPGFRHALLDQVIPRVLAQAGRLIIHCSAVATPSGALSLVGASGRGKSTLAAAFHAQGTPLLADDSLLLTAESAGVFGTPAYPGVRLWPEVANRLNDSIASQAPLGYVADKLRCELDGMGRSETLAGPLPIRAILSLRRWRPQDRNARVRLSRLPSAVAATELMENAFLFDIGDRAHLSQMLRQAARVAASVPVFLARYPSDLGRLPEVCAQILGLIPPVPGAAPSD